MAKAAVDAEAELAARDNADGLGAARRELILSEGRKICSDAGPPWFTSQHVKGCCNACF